MWLRNRSHYQCGGRTCPFATQTELKLRGRQRTLEAEILPQRRDHAQLPIRGPAVGMSPAIVATRVTDPSNDRVVRSNAKSLRASQLLLGDIAFLPIRE